MSPQEIPYLSIREASTLIGLKKLSPVELVRAVLARIDRIEPKVHAFVTLRAEEALLAARAVEREITRKKYRGPLHGIPVGVKDTHYTKGIKTTAATPALADFVPSFDATVVERLRDAGAILLGKMNLPEFSFGGLTPGTYNPWDLSRTPGGSSGGSAAALAAGFLLGATGGDTTGSIRGPASYCGVVGLKPTFGLVSRYGITVISWSLDHVGPMTRTVEDNALMLNVLAGFDANDRSSVEVKVPNYAKALSRKVRGLRMGIPRPSLLEGVHDDVLRSFHEAVGVFKKLGVKIREIDIPFMREAEAAQRIIRISEASAYHETFLKNQPQRYGPSNVRRDVEAGSLITAAQYIRAQRVRGQILLELEKALEDLDVLLTPGESEPAGEPQRGKFNFKSYFNLTGLPGLALPSGFSVSPPGLPLGVQIVAGPFEEEMVYAVGHAYQSVTDWHTRRPPSESKGS
ncbi:MAG: Asp-tRNA(Asn)/Glu-tRNA(Gln) amidotransferase GatCAB subunit A [Deltaproteobacteria bacterium]|nr:Asp-tRNA(Asn)/Glu-tRNA(Gln) amidotransferase GatCAB subunit A [Deltaproteobacteria bacterium]